MWRIGVNIFTLSAQMLCIANHDVAFLVLICDSILESILLGDVLVIHGCLQSCAEHLLLFFCGLPR